MYQTLIYEKENGAAVITINRPEVMNIHNTAMRDDLFEVLSAVRQDTEIRTVMIKGAGEKAFCAGADLSEFLTAPPPVQAREIRFDADLWQLFTTMPQPLLCAVQGYCLGSGIEIMLCCDWVVASQDARFGLPEVGLGIIPAAGGTQTVPRAAGLPTALEMMLMNRWLTAEEALHVGLVNRVVPRQSLYAEAQAAAEHLDRRHSSAVRSIKQALLAGCDLTLEQGLNLERRLNLKLAADKSDYF